MHLKNYIGRLAGRPRTYIKTLKQRQECVGYAIYYLIDLDGEEVVYVGQTTDPTSRARSHECARRGLRLKVVCIVGTNDEAVRVEKALIALQKERGADLLNETAGGAGGTPYGRRKVADLLRPYSPEEDRAHRVELKRMWREGARIAEMDK